MDAYNVSFGEAIVRYFVMMLLIIVGVFTGWWVLAVVALPVFLTALTGMCPVKRYFQKAKTAEKTQLSSRRSAPSTTAKAA